MAASISCLLAEKIIETYSAPHSPDVSSLAKDAILDTIGVMLAGSADQATKIALDVVAGGHSNGSCSVIGSRNMLDPFDAALINGILGHALDYDDSNYQMYGHPSIAVIPALITAAEQVGISGREFICAYLTGFEAAARIGEAVNPYQYLHGWHPTTTIGIFAAVAAAGVVHRASVEELANALGIAVSMASSVKSNFGTMTKPLGVGLLSRNALLALQLSRRGFTAAPDAFEHHHGYFNVFNNGEANYDVSRALKAWHEPWAIVDKGVNKKRFPCCYACLAPIDGLLNILENHHLDHRHIRTIACEVHPARFPHINVPEPDTALAAKFSVHYCLALAAVKGRLEIADFEGDLTRDEEVRRLMRCVEFGSYENNDNITGSRVVLTTVEGATHEVFVERPLGSALKPLTPQGLHDKFMDCGKRALSPARAEELYGLLVRLDEIEDFGDVIRKARPIE